MSGCSYALSELMQLLQQHISATGLTKLDLSNFYVELDIYVLQKMLERSDNIKSLSIFGMKKQNEIVKYALVELLSRYLA